MISEIKCWNCANISNNFSFFCVECQLVQKPGDIDSFELFNLSYSFSINLEALEAKYYNLLNKLHPDKFINSSEKELLYAQMHSSNLNNAYNTLTNVVSRSNELLKCKGEKNEQVETFDDLCVLNEILDLQEVAEKIEGEDQRMNFIEQIDKKIGENVRKLEGYFIQNQLLEAKKLTVKISYLEKLIKDVRK